MAENEQNRKRILFVDDDMSFLDMITKVFLSWSKDSWETVTAGNTGKAIAILQEKAVDLIVIDVHMPGVDGLQFLRLIERKYPNLPKVVLSADNSEEVKKACLDGGAELFLTKATSIEGMESIFATLQEMTKWQTDDGFRGVMRRIGLQEILQIECLNKNSSVLEISANRIRGQVFIQDGKIIHAQIGSLKGENAFYQIMALRAGDFNLQPFKDPGVVTIDASWEHLLMEGARLRDEGGGENQLESLLAESVASSEVGATELTQTVQSGDQFNPDAIAAGRDFLAPKVNEMLVVSAKGEVLYEDQSPTEERLSLINLVSDRLRKIGASLPLGKFSGIDINADNHRMLMHQQGDNWVVIRISRGSGGTA